MGPFNLYRTSIIPMILPGKNKGQKGICMHQYRLPDSRIHKKN